MITKDIQYDFTFASDDPEGDDIAEYIINWGDGTPEETLTGPFTSGDPQQASHTWTVDGTYIITARAKDVNDLTGPEGSHQIVIPRSRAINMPLVVRFLQNHPNIFPILRTLLGL